MISKICLAFLAISVMMLSSCTEFTKGKPKKEEVVEIKQDAMGCLKDVALDVKNFMKSEVTPSDIDKTFACIDDTLSQFQTRVEGRQEANAFNAEELFEIFEKFIEDSNISREATRDLLTLKTALLGGSDQKITKEELTELRSYLLVIREEAKNLLPYAQLYTFQKTEAPLAKTMIKDGFAQLNLSLKKLLASSRMSQSSYGFEDFKRTIKNMNVLKEDQQGMLELADKVNTLLIGQQSAGTESERQIYIDNLTEVLRLYSTHIHGHVKFEISTPVVLNNLLEFIEDAVTLLENTLQYRKTQKISMASIDPLISEVFEKEMMPLPVSSTTALSFYKTIVVRVLESGLAGDIMAFDGIKRVHFSNLKREIAVYKIYSKYLETVASESILAASQNRRIPVETIQRQLRQFDPATETAILNDFDSETQRLIVNIVKELKEQFLIQKPSIYRNKKLMLYANQNLAQQNWVDLTRGFYVTMLSRQMLLGWGETPFVKLVKNAHTSKRGMVQWYNEFKNFGIEIKAMDPRVENQGEASVIAANLFTAAGNGDDKMSFLETIQSFNILISGGQTFNEIKQGLANANCNLSDMDVFGNPWNNEACFIGELKRGYKYYFSNLPALSVYVERLTAEQFQDFFVALLDAARKEEANKGVRLESADIKMMVSLLYYMESLYAAHDGNNNFLLSPTEIRTAYPKFKNFATEFAREHSKAELDKFNGRLGRVAYSCYAEEDLIRESFIFLLFKGRTPKQEDLSTLPCVVTPGILRRITPDNLDNRRPLIQHEGEVGRRTIINTFKILKAVLSS